VKRYLVKFLVQVSIFNITLMQISSLYEPYRQSSSTVDSYYVAVFKNAVLHQSGQVGTKCSMFQGVEGCETRFNISMLSVE